MSTVDPAWTDPAATLTKQQKIFTVVGVLLGMLLAALDQTIVSTAGPAIQADLRIEAGLYAWLTTSYLVASTVMVPIYGKLSDLFGRRRILLIGIAIFLSGSLLCGFSQTAMQLIAARAIQGLGSAALFTSALAVIADIFPPAERGKWQGLFGAVFGLSSVVGPLAGGFITDTFGWHWVFFINLPLGAVAVSFILSKMPPLRPPEGRARPSIDLAGAFFLAVFSVPLLLALTLGRTAGSPQPGGYPWASKEILGLFALSFAGLVTFIVVELRAKEPIVPMALFRIRAFATGNVAAFIVGAAFLASIVFLPLYMVNVIGLSATNAGLTTIPLTFGLVLGNVLSGQLVSRLGRYKGLMLGSLVLLAVAYALMGYTITADTTQAQVTWRMVLVGLGLGPGIPLYTLAIQNSVPPQQIGVATSAGTFFRQMGSTIGIAIFGTVFAGALGDAMQTRLAAATEGIPAEFRQQLGGPPAAGSENAGGGEEGVQIRKFPRAEIEARVKATFAEQRELLEKALAKDDATAAAALAANPRTDERLKAILPGGKGAEGMRVPFELAKAKLLEATQAGDLAAYDALAAAPPIADLLKNDPSLAANREELQNKDPHAIGRLAFALDQVGGNALKMARLGALAGATKGLEAAETQALASVAKVDRALKEGFTDAIATLYRWAIVIALLGFIATAMLPELPLRGGRKLEPVGE